MNAFLVILSLCLLSACAPLHPHTSAWGDAGEVVARVLVCPVTLCTSELILHMEHQAEEQRFAYARWYNSLSAEQRAREDQRDALRLQALGLALSGGGPSFAVPLAPVAPRSSFGCVSRTVGSWTYLDCP